MTKGRNESILPPMIFKLYPVNDDQVLGGQNRFLPELLMYD